MKAHEGEKEKYLPRASRWLQILHSSPWLALSFSERANHGSTVDVRSDADGLCIRAYLQKPILSQHYELYYELYYYITTLRTILHYELSENTIQ